MLSLPKLSTAETGSLLSLLPIFLLLHSSARVQGVSLREHRMRGSQPDPHLGGHYIPPNADMLKALEYIESLRQRTGLAPHEHQQPLPDYDSNDMDNTQKLRAILRLGSQAQSQSQNRGDGGEEEEEEASEEDKTQEWLQAVLSTLKQSEKRATPGPVRSSAARHTLDKGWRMAKDEDGESKVGGGANPWARQHGSQPHREYPLLFEDEKWGEREEEERASERKNPFKRTNENVEEKYTPQNLATLQSVFEELGRLSNTKAGHKRQEPFRAGDDEDDDNEDDDDDMFRVGHLAYEDVMGGEDWTPLEEQVKTEEEERDNREEFDRVLDDDDYEEEEEEADDEDDQDNYEVKRSNQPGLGEDPDDITKLVDYYLLRVLEKTEQEKQKRELEEEERAERRAAQSQNSDSIDQQAIYQLIQISQKLQIPPEDLLDMLKTGEITKQDRNPQTGTPNELARKEEKLTQISTQMKNRSLPAKFYNKGLPETETSHIPEDINTEDILRILGLGGMGNQNAAPLKKEKQHKSSPSRFYAPVGRQGDYIFSQPSISKVKDDDDTVDEDEFATYLAAQMLAQYPEAANNKADHKRASQSPSRAEQLVLGTFEQAIQNYFDQMDSDKSPPQKRQSETKDKDNAIQTQGMDDDTLLEILSYLNPEKEESEYKDLYDETDKGM